MHNDIKPITVLIVDDSSVIRKIIREVISDDPEIKVVGEAKDPLVARELIKKLNPDIITLDVEMPKMDGITFLDNLMRLRPMPVLMLSTLTTKGADITLQALELGAIDFIAKPSFEELFEDKNAFKDILIHKIKNAVKIDQKNYYLNNALANDTSKNALVFNGSIHKNQIIAIGASTGGIEAIREVVKRLPKNSPPVVIAQHIPKTFSERFAKRLDMFCNITVQEAKHGMKIKTGHAYVAPGDQHLTIVLKGDSLFCILDDSAPVNRHKPAVDVLFKSLVPIAQSAQAVLLTGMGADGAAGMLDLKNAGARTIIQDKNSSLIWGMPGSAYKIDAHTDEYPLASIAETLLNPPTKVLG